MRFSCFDRLLTLRGDAPDPRTDPRTAQRTDPRTAQRLAGQSVEGPWPEEERSGYESGTVLFGGELWRIRTARVTPTKPGAFVAVWERGGDGATRPFSADDRAAGLLVFVEEGDRFGVFRFARPQLAELGITRSADVPGKRGFRVYPAWSTGLNAQAARSQQLQAAAFERLA